MSAIIIDGISNGEPYSNSGDIISFWESLDSFWNVSTINVSTELFLETVPVLAINGFPETLITFSK